MNNLVGWSGWNTYFKSCPICSSPTEFLRHGHGRFRCTQRYIHTTYVHFLVSISLFDESINFITINLPDMAIVYECKFKNIRITNREFTNNYPNNEKDYDYYYFNFKINTIKDFEDCIGELMILGKSHYINKLLF